MWTIGKSVKKELASVLVTSDRRRKRLPGYKTLTVGDYEDIYSKLKEELRKELEESAESDISKTEYSAEDEEK